MERCLATSRTRSLHACLPDTGHRHQLREPGTCQSRAYPSDLSEQQWALLAPRARAIMAELVRISGRPMVHDLRAVLDAIGYVTRYGIEWRALPVDFPPWQAVFAFFKRWTPAACRDTWWTCCTSGSGWPRPRAAAPPPDRLTRKA